MTCCCVHCCLCCVVCHTTDELFVTAFESKIVLLLLLPSQHCCLCIVQFHVLWCFVPINNLVHACQSAADISDHLQTTKCHSTNELWECCVVHLSAGSMTKYHVCFLSPPHCVDAPSSSTSIPGHCAISFIACVVLSIVVKVVCSCQSSVVNETPTSIQPLLHHQHCFVFIVLIIIMRTSPPNIAHCLTFLTTQIHPFFILYHS